MDRAGWRSDSLGEQREVEVGGARLRAYVAGDGPTVVLVHGLLVNANLWRKVVPKLTGVRAVTLDLPLGSHVLPAPDADLSTPGLAGLVAGALEGLGLDDVTLVGNDTGGAISQLVATSCPERVGRLVLTSCDAFDNFPPRMFRYLKPLSKVPLADVALFLPLRIRANRRLPIAYGWLMKGALDADAGDSYVLPGATRADIRADLRRAIAGIDPRHTLDAAEALARFDKPALIAWSTEDRFFPAAHAERLARLIPDARLEWVEGARTFSPEDRPERLAELVSSFARERAPAAA